MISFKFPASGSLPVIFISLKGTKLEGLLKVYLASKMAAKISFQSNLEFTGEMRGGIILMY